MKTREATRYFGGASALARVLVIDRNAVYQWGEHPPIGRQYQIEVLTDGALRAERPGDTRQSGD